LRWVRFDSLKANEAPRQQGRAQHQDGGSRDFEDVKRAARPPACARAVSRPFEPLAGIDVCGAD
jgi:hypothetical protein